MSLSRKDLLLSIFGVEFSETEYSLKYDRLGAYLEWCDEQCEAHGGQPADLNSILNLLRSMFSEPRQAILNVLISDEASSTVVKCNSSSLLQKYSPDKESSLNAILALAARLCTMVSFDPPDFIYVPGRDISWPQESSLASTIHSVFQTRPEPSENMSFPKGFTAANLELIAGIKVGWTSNLADHLSLTCDDTKVMLFYHASFLELQKRSSAQMYPPNLITETIQTFALLMPSTDYRTKRWFQRKQKVSNLDRNAGTYGPLNAEARQIKHFHYWRDRLFILKQTFDDLEPHDIMSWWYDDRRKVQRATFWVAFLVLMLTIFFGLLQLIVGTVQAWAAVKALQIVG